MKLQAALTVLVLAACGRGGPSAAGGPVCGPEASTPTVRLIDQPSMYLHAQLDDAVFVLADPATEGRYFDLHGAQLGAVVPVQAPAAGLHLDFFSLHTLGSDALLAWFGASKVVLQALRRNGVPEVIAELSPSEPWSEVRQVLFWRGNLVVLAVVANQGLTALRLVVIESGREREVLKLAGVDGTALVVGDELWVVGFETAVDHSSKLTRLLPGAPWVPQAAVTLPEGRVTLALCGADVAAAFASGAGTLGVGRFSRTGQLAAVVPLEPAQKNSMPSVWCDTTTTVVAYTQETGGGGGAATDSGIRVARLTQDSKLSDGPWWLSTFPKMADQAPRVVRAGDGFVTTWVRSQDGVMGYRILQKPMPCP